MSDKRPVDELPPDAESLEQWRQMPQGKPSKHAFAPATGGLRWLWWLVVLGGLLIVVAILANSGLT
ncbi:MAG: hypothetical protein RLP44_30165 [Aggregatilineales bacterium]